MTQRCIYYEECLKITYPVDPECDGCLEYTTPEETEEEMILQERRSK